MRGVDRLVSGARTSSKISFIIHKMLGRACERVLACGFGDPALYVASVWLALGHADDAYLPAAARRFMYSSKDSDLGMCVCLALGSLGSRVVGLGSRVCGLVSADINR